MGIKISAEETSRLSIVCATQAHRNLNLSKRPGDQIGTVRHLLAGEDFVSSSDSSVLASDDGNICSAAPGHFLKAFGSIWGSALALKSTDMDINERVIADYISTVPSNGI